MRTRAEDFDVRSDHEQGAVLARDKLRDVGACRVIRHLKGEGARVVVAAGRLRGAGGDRRLVAAVGVGDAFLRHGVWFELQLVRKMLGRR